MRSGVGSRGDVEGLLARKPTDRRFNSETLLDTAGAVFVRSFAVMAFAVLSCAVQVRKVSAERSLVVGFASKVVFVEVPFLLGSATHAGGRAGVAVTVFIVNCVRVGYPVRGVLELTLAEQVDLVELLARCVRLVVQ